MPGSLAFMVVMVTFIGCYTAITIIQTVHKGRTKEDRSHSRDLERRVAEAERRLENLETIATSREYTLEKDFEALSRN